MKSLQNKTAAIVPAFNERNNVGKVLKVLLESAAFEEIILVDDGSQDGTWEVGQKLGVRVIRLEKNKGKGNAMFQGLKSTDAPIIAFFDGDLKNLSVGHVSSLMDPVKKQEAVMCVGVRGRWLGLPSFFVKVDPILALGGERVLKRDVLENIPEKFVQGFAVEQALNFYCLVKRLKVKHVLLKGLAIATKEEKWGFLRGFAARIKMVCEIISARIRLILNKDEFI